MDRDTWNDLGSEIMEAWPDADFTPAHVDVYWEHLHDLDAKAVDAAIVAWEERFDKPPSAQEIRALALATMGDPPGLPREAPASPPPQG